MEPAFVFPSLAHTDRRLLFDQLSLLDSDQLPPAERAVFGERPGWLVSDFGVARAFLGSSAGVKSRPRSSQHRLGGVGADQGRQVRILKRELLMAMGELARQRGAMLEHVAAALEARGHPASPVASLTEAFSAATVAQVAGAQPGSVDQPLLRNMVMRTWATIENPDGDAALHDDLHAHLLTLIRASDSAFVRSLRADGWADERMAEELRGMLLAGWGSTAAAVTSAVSLGVASRLNDDFMFDEVVRLYPPSFMIGRTVTERAPSLPFEPGDIVVVSPWLIHRNSRGWDDPLSFDVGRWRAAREGAPWFLPFGIGPRRCPASTFARVQAQTAGLLLRESRIPARTTVVLLEGRSPALVAASE